MKSTLRLMTSFRGVEGAWNVKETKLTVVVFYSFQEVLNLSKQKRSYQKIMRN